MEPALHEDSALSATPRGGLETTSLHCPPPGIYENVLFNTCRESSDHGPINSWDRQPVSFAA